MRPWRRLRLRLRLRLRRRLRLRVRRVFGLDEQQRGVPRGVEAGEAAAEGLDEVARLARHAMRRYGEMWGRCGGDVGEIQGEIAPQPRRAVPGERRWVISPISPLHQMTDGGAASKMRLEKMVASPYAP